MGLFENCSTNQEMFWNGSSEAAYDPSTDSSPSMPHLHHDNHFPPTFATVPHHPHINQVPPQHTLPSSTVHHSTSHHNIPHHLPPPPHHLPMEVNSSTSLISLHDGAPLTPSSGGSSSGSSPPSVRSFCSPSSKAPDSRGATAPPLNTHFMSPPPDERSSAGVMPQSPGVSQCRSTCVSTPGIVATTTTICNGGSLSASSNVTTGKVSTAASSGPGRVCAACSMNILDPFYLVAIQKNWHSGCLRCVTCKIPLDSPRTLFTRDGLIFCKEDYYRIFGSVKCARCTQPFIDTQMVMRAKDFVYHMDCFVCDVCNTRLNKGEHFGMAGTHLYCSEHFQMAGGRETGHISPYEHSSPHHHLPQGGGPPVMPYPPPIMPPLHGGGGVPPTSITPDGCYPGQLGGGKMFTNSTGPVKSQNKKRRKPKEEPMDTTNLSEYFIPSNYDLESPYGPMGGQQVRSKRIRTSFKHHQIRTMRSYFETNHNPDAKDLKYLSQKTNLSKRVLQVWFQNARAKYRRQMSNKEQKNGGQPGGDSTPRSTGGDAGSVEGATQDPNSTDTVYESKNSVMSVMSPCDSEDSQRDGGGLFCRQLRGSGGDPQGKRDEDESIGDETYEEYYGDEEEAEDTEEVDSKDEIIAPKKELSLNESDTSLGKSGQKVQSNHNNNNSKERVNIKEEAIEDEGKNNNLTDLQPCKKEDTSFASLLSDPGASIMSPTLGTYTSTFSAISQSSGHMPPHMVYPHLGNPLYPPPYPHSHHLHPQQASSCFNPQVGPHGAPHFNPMWREPM